MACRSQVACAYAGGGDGQIGFMPYPIPARVPRRQGCEGTLLDSGQAPGDRCSSPSTASSRKRFIDELAHARRRIPTPFRLNLLGDEPRFTGGVLERVAAMAGWTSPLPPREGRGISYRGEASDRLSVQVADRP